MIALRQYCDGDAPATVGVFRQAVTRTAAAHYTAEQIGAWCPDDIDVAEWGARRAQAWTVVAVEAGTVVGFADLVDVGELDMLFVHPDAAGRGVARALVEAVLAEARRRGLSRVTTRASRTARPVFERLGFVVDAEVPGNIIRGVIVPNARMHADLG